MQKTDVKTLADVVGRAIARQRERCKLSQEQVAERLGIGSEAVSRIERGIVMPNIERLVALADIFGCETADLLTQASPRSEDQAVRISQMLNQLGSDDRQLVLELIERLSHRLGKS
ncbi:helix-turn-helix domain-containing protein [Ectopseudomonas toyotomiensis]|uniref:Helix-turn-helix domain-containing protein n=1 Tax=Ectopseudomonas toyotomiensis TaxID=554344 RepID=A0AA42IK67_9GAMM|nr:helix-turn-helix transcriptional regulator [Pseudomonas toyotomiensis]MBG0843504.1 helix-turn-helix transcriptional regulator [Pseudomonas toyotomiensis]MDH0701318.1 helix-turn-helix domain-containing protein [Pseudomonas toyotomiensis]